jgi:ABC-type thiamine transport system ATPase subunit
MATPNLKVVAAAAKRPVIEIAGVSKTYRTQDGDVPSLRPLDFSVDQGEFLVVVGPSGCGKSTLLKLIAGLLPPSEGEIRVESRVVTKPHADVGIVFQSPLLLPWRSVFRNVLMPVEVKGLPRAEYEQRAHALLKMVGLEGFENKYPWQLSGGMQQRASICRALVRPRRNSSARCSSRARALLAADHREMVLVAVEPGHEHDAGLVEARRRLEDVARQRHRRREDVVEAARRRARARASAATRPARWRRRCRAARPSSPARRRRSARRS